MTEMNAWIMSSYLFYPHFLDTPEQESNYHPQAKSDLLPIFVNKVLLEHVHAHLSVYCLWLLSCCSSRIVEYLQYRLHKPSAPPC